MRINTKPKIIKSDQTPAEIGEENQKRLKAAIEDRKRREKYFLYGSPKEMKSPSGPVLYNDVY